MNTTVLMVLDSVFPARGGGGAESQVATLCAGLRSRGIPVSVLVPMSPIGPQTRDDVVEGVPVRRIAYPRVRVLGLLVLLLRLAWVLFSRRSEYTVIHAHVAMDMATVSALIGRLLGKPVIVKITGMTELRGGILDPDPRLRMRILRVCLRSANTMQATSVYIRDRLVDVGFDPKRVVLIPNAVDDERFSVPAPSPHPLSPSLPAGLDAIYVGRLQVEKGVEVLLRAWARAFGADHRCSLTLVGDGRLRESLNELAAELGISESVRFMGHSDQVHKHLAVANLGVLPSFAEGLSNTMLEYMAAGLPVIASRVSGAPDFIEDGISGWLFEPGDVEGLAQRLVEARDLGTEKLRSIGRGGRELVRIKASRASVLDALLHVYRSEPSEGVRSSCAE